MNNSQPNNKNQVHTQQNNSSQGNTNQPSHFVQAQKMVNAWPEWKRNACSAATASNDNSTSTSDKK
jgi:hypothetical protein